MKKRLFLLSAFLFLSLIIIFLNVRSSADFINNKNVLKVTLEHPFYLNGEWIPASELKVGDELFTIDGKKARITGIKEVYIPEGIEVYNLEVKGYENYIVENGVVVHNSNVPIIGMDALENALKTMRQGDQIRLRDVPDTSVREKIARTCLDNNMECVLVGKDIIMGSSSQVLLPKGLEVGSDSFWHPHTLQDGNSYLFPSGATTVEGRVESYLLAKDYVPNPAGRGDYATAIEKSMKEIVIGGVVNGKYKELRWKVPSLEDYIRMAENPKWVEVKGLRFNEELVKYSLGDDWKRILEESLP